MYGQTTLIPAPILTFNSSVQYLHVRVELHNLIILHLGLHVLHPVSLVVERDVVCTHNPTYIVQAMVLSWETPILWRRNITQPLGFVAYRSEEVRVVYIVLEYEWGAIIAPLRRHFA